jgi:hypothetical protein
VLVSTREREAGGSKKTWHSSLPVFREDGQREENASQNVFPFSTLWERIPRVEREKNLPGKGESILPRKWKILPPPGNGKRFPLRGMGRESLCRGMGRELPSGEGEENPSHGEENKKSLQEEREENIRSLGEGKRDLFIGWKDKFEIPSPG